MFGALKNKLNSGKKDLKLRMDNTHVRSTSSENNIEIIANGNKEIIDIKISSKMYTDTEQLEDELLVTLNRVLTKADLLYQSELKEEMSANMPDIPGLEGLLDEYNS